MANPKFILKDSILITGKVYDGENNPISDAMIELWQNDGERELFGRFGTGTDAKNRFIFRTIKPKSVDGQAPYINLIIFMRGQLIHSYTRIYFSDEMELNEIPVNYFAHVEQATFSPSNLINGISFSPDKMLQGRLFSYPDAHRYRVGANSHLLEVNRCLYNVNNYQRDGAMADSSQYKDAPNYYPNSFDNIKPSSKYKNFEEDLDSTHVANFNRNENDDDHYTQPGLLYTKAMDNTARQNLVSNIVTSMKGISGPKRDEIINRQLCHFFRANIELGMKIAMGLQVNIDGNMMSHSNT